MRFVRLRSLLALCAIASMLIVVAVNADARPGGSFGSRGSRTFTAPPATNTAPNTARPIERSMTQPGQPGGNLARPATPATQPGGLFGRPGFFGGLAAGFLGAGLIGLLLGHGLTGGLAGFASFFGLLLQLGLIAIVGYMLWSWWQRRNQPAFAGGPSMRNVYSDGPRPGGLAGDLGGGLGYGAGTAPASDTVNIAADDFNTFERLLGEIETAYGAEDLNQLRARVTPEMLSYFAEELAANASRGVVNRISDIKLLQGDLSEAWSEGNTEYATVAMRFSLNDQMVDRASGHVVEGGPDEATEVWTFMRTRSGTWLLSAIQQV